MCRKIVCCYVFILLILDLTTKTKLTAQAKSHGVTVHDSLIEGITFQEWGKEEAGVSGVAAADALRLEPATLTFGRASLGAAHALTVSLTNTANTTVHLASVAGTTPDFHASFFDSKTLAPLANTSFSVVYLGRREGPVSAHLYIHTSLGIHKYPVSAVGVASEWGLWPVVGVRVPQNASLEPSLTLHNPTSRPLQVREVYASASWLQLRLPQGGARASSALWTIPPHSTRPLVRLVLAPEGAHSLTAYVRIKANITGPPLVVAVEAVAAAPGEYLRPLQLRPGVRGSRDSAEQLDIAVGNSATAPLAVEASVWGARCEPQPVASPPPPAPSDPPAPAGNGCAVGAGAGGARVEPARVALPPRGAPEPTLRLSLDYGALWAEAGADQAAEAWCVGWVRAGRSALPYSVRLVPGTLRLTPPAVDLVTTSAAAREPVAVRAHNDFSTALRLLGAHCEPELSRYMHVDTSGASTVLSRGATAEVLRLRLHPDAPPAPLRSTILLRTNVTQYALPVRVYDGRFTVEWEWVNATSDLLELGAVSTERTLRVGMTLRNAAPAALCLRELRTDVPGGSVALEPEAGEPSHPDRCLPPEGRVAGWLTVAAAGASGALSGSVWAESQHARATTRVTLRAVRGELRLASLHSVDAAPFAWGSATVLLENSMAEEARVVHAEALHADAATRVRTHAEGVTLTYAPEALCAPRCYAGLDLDSPEGAAWLRRGATALDADAALARERYAAFSRAPHSVNVTLLVHTTLVPQVTTRGRVRAYWPRLTPAADASPRDALAAVGGAERLRVVARNPSRSHALLLQAALGPRWAAPGVDAEAACGEECVWADDAFALSEWRATEGTATPARAPSAPSLGVGRSLPMLLLQPDAAVELVVTFAPKTAAAFAAHLYLRNNLTVVEAVRLSGRGAYPSFEIGGRRPGAAAPLLFEVSECAEGVGSVRRSLVARNTGRVAVHLREWRIAGHACNARGFRVAPCAPFVLAPNHSRPLRVAFAADMTVARVHAALHVRTDTGLAEFSLVGSTSARLLPPCAAATPRPPWERALRTAGSLVALAAAALALAAAALDAERILRRARVSRPPPHDAPPLDLRSLARAPPAPSRTAPPPPPPPRRRRPPPARRPLPPLDPLAERRAFERWRAEVLRRERRADDDSSRSSEDADAPAPPVLCEDADADADAVADVEADAPSSAEPLLADSPPPPDDYETEADTEPNDEERPRSSAEEDDASTGSDSSLPADDAVPARPPTPPDADRADDAAGVDADVVADADAAADAPGRFGRASVTRRERPRTVDPSRPAKQPPRKRSAKRRERSAATPPRRSPPPSEARSAVRWGASFSSVVARGGLAPIGSDVPRRRSPPPVAHSAAALPPGPDAADNSLFFYNDAWRSPGERLPFVASQRDYRLQEEQPAATGGAFGSIGSAWAGDRWLWSGGSPRPAPPPPLRPPPGFGPRAPAPAAPLRPFDPFRSPLASIWAPAEHDWRREDRQRDDR